MKNFLIGVAVTAVSAFLFEMTGAWWAMPVAGAFGGYWVKKGGQGFAVGAAGVALVWGAFLAMTAAISPVGALLRLFAAIVELGDSLDFAPVVLALVVAAVLGGAGGLTGALIAELQQRLGQRP